MSFEGFPEELVSLILSKLPVKSLLRLKSVQKSWYSLIESPQFIRLHRSSSSSSPQFIARCCIEQPRHVLSFYSYESLADLRNEIIDLPISSCLNCCGYWGVVSLSAPCDGLVCITNHNDEILICNPALREFRSLSAPGYHIDSVALGSDPNTGQYKVVMIGVPYEYDNNSHINDTGDDYCRYDDREALVYDSINNSWRKTSVVIPAPFRYSCCAVLLNGAFHWSPWDDSNILTFHISNEVTNFIPLPDFVEENQQIELCVLSKSQLSIILYDFDLMRRFEICVMTEYGVKESWTRLFVIGPLSGFYEPLACWDEEHLLLQL